MASATSRRSPTSTPSSTTGVRRTGRDPERRRALDLRAVGVARRRRARCSTTSARGCSRRASSARTTTSAAVAEWLAVLRRHERRRPSSPERLRGAIRRPGTPMPRHSDATGLSASASVAECGRSPSVPDAGRASLARRATSPRGAQRQARFSPSKISLTLTCRRTRRRGPRRSAGRSTAPRSGRSASPAAAAACW